MESFSKPIRGSQGETERRFLGQAKLLACSKIGKEAAGTLRVHSLLSVGLTWSLLGWTDHSHPPQEAGDRIF
jgi:hypothetical protein